jgi:hypothetical protein
MENKHLLVDFNEKLTQAAYNYTYKLIFTVTPKWIIFPHFTFFKST